jgi:hypothetical protein
MPSAGRPTADVIETGKLREQQAPPTGWCAEAQLLSTSPSAPLTTGNPNVPQPATDAAAAATKLRDETMHCLDLP